MRSIKWFMAATVAVGFCAGRADAQQERGLACRSDYCTAARDDCDHECYLVLNGDICSNVQTTEQLNPPSCSVSYICCYSGCTPDCPPGYTHDCVGDQQPDQCGCCVNYPQTDTKPWRS